MEKEMKVAFIVAFVIVCINLGGLWWYLKTTTPSLTNHSTSLKCDR